MLSLVEWPTQFYAPIAKTLLSLHPSTSLFFSFLFFSFLFFSFLFFSFLFFSFLFFSFLFFSFLFFSFLFFSFLFFSSLSPLPSLFRQSHPSSRPVRVRDSGAVCDLMSFGCATYPPRSLYKMLALTLLPKSLAQTRISSTSGGRRGGRREEQTEVLQVRCMCSEDVCCCSGLRARLFTVTFAFPVPSVPPLVPSCPRS